MLTLTTPDTFEQALKIRSIGQVHFVDIVYRNLEPEALDQESEARGTKFTDEELVIRLVEKWDIDVPLTEDGIKALQKARPGVVQAVIEGFFRGRVAALEKN